MTRAATYLRISHDPLANELGVLRQEDDIRDFLARRGYEVVAEFVDNDLSAFSGVRRPGWEALLDTVRAGGVDVVVAWANDRMYARVEDQLALLRACVVGGATVATVKDGDLNPADASGAMVMTILASVSGFERARKGERQRLANLHRARSGRPASGGRRPFGYAEDKVTVVPDEAAAIREAAERLIAGDGLNTIARDFTARGVMTTDGKPWRRGPLRVMLRSARIAGLREYRGEVVGEAEWPAIITPALHAAILDATNTNRPRAARRYLLSGIARCGRCKTAMCGRVVSKTGREGYYCVPAPAGRGCGRVSIVADRTEAEVVSYVLASLADWDDFQAEVVAERGADDSEVLRLIAAAEARKEELAAMWGAGELSRNEFTAAKGAIDADLERLRARAAISPRNTALAPFMGLDRAALGRLWDRTPVDRQRAIIREVLDGPFYVAPTRLPGSKAYDRGRLSFVEDAAAA